MNPQHHVDQATLVSYASGALPQALAVVTATHLEVCAHCRDQLRDADAVGGMLLERQQEDRIDPASFARLRESMLERMQQSACAPMEVADAAGRDACGAHDPDHLPVPLHAYFGKSFSALRWRWLAPGVHLVRAKGMQEGSLFMLKIAPGKSMPLHSHGNSELTQILRGAYDDALGHFAVGDMADLDRNIEHKPVTAPGVPCVCVAALDAPLLFPGWLMRILQPLFGL